MEWYKKQSIKLFIMLFLCVGITQAFAGNKVFTMHLKSKRWTVTQDGALVRSGPGSGGKGYCPDIHRTCHTPRGTFSVIGKGGADCYSQKYKASMAYCTFFREKYAIHSSPNYLSGSHGCIRVKRSDAKWINQTLKIGDKVVISL